MTMGAARAAEPPAELDELTLVRAQRGDRAACRALVVRYQQPVFGLLHRMLGGHPAHAQVEDLAQETFLRVFKALPGFRRDGPARLSTWILTMASNLAVDELRRRRPALATVDEAERLSAPQRSDQGVDQASLKRAVQDALARLPEDQRALLILRTWHDASHEELCTVLGLELGTVKSRLSRARAALHAALTRLEVMP